MNNYILQISMGLITYPCLKLKQFFLSHVIVMGHRVTGQKSSMYNENQHYTLYVLKIHNSAKIVN